MDSFRKNLHLTRQEAGMVFILVVLLSGLMFSVGLWVGFSFSGNHPELASTDSHADHGRSPASAEKPKKAVLKAPVAGDELRKSFHESKQKALTEVVVESSSADTPKSILDTKAHQGVHSEWNRRPASANEVSEDEAKAMDKIQAAERARKKEGPPVKVSNLFERSPSAVKDFDPTPGSYTLQLASFATLDESAAMVRDLRKAGFLDAYTQEISFKNGEKWHRVAMGSYPNPVYARKMGERLRRRSLAKDFIVRKVAD
jgi:cell division septation protein DedD